MSEPANLFDDIATWVPEPQRAQYWEMVGHLTKLPADDEILRLCQAMGVLALITRQLPGELATERNAWDAGCEQRRRELASMQKATEEQVQARTEQIAAVLTTLDDTGIAMKASAARIDAALRHFAEDLPVTAIVAKLQGSLTTTLLQPAETAIARAAQTYEKLGDLTTVALETTRKLDQFTSRQAWRTSVLVCSALTIAFLMVSWQSLRAQSREAIKLAIEQVNARAAGNEVVLRQLNGLGRRVSLQRDGASEGFYLIFEDADSAWCGDAAGKKNAVIRFAVKSDTSVFSVEPEMK